MTLAQWLQRSQQLLEGAGSESPALEARLLLAYLLTKPTSYLFTWPEQLLTNIQQKEAEALLQRRLTGEPMAYILGEQEFYGYAFKVSPATLIPRPDTELLVERALALAPPDTLDVLDLGTGTGAIALSLAKQKPSWQLLAVDKSAAALAIAEQNKVALNISNCTFLLSDWFSEITQRFQMIVSNPPYIAPNDEHLSRGDVRFEPNSALVAEESGLADIVHLVNTAQSFLAPGGLLVLEHGYNQGPEVRRLMEAAGWQGVTTEQDYGAQDRITYGYATFTE